MKRFAVLACGLAMVLGSVSLAAAWKPAPAPRSIKEVMKVAHKDGLLKKIVDGQGTDEDKKLLLDLYIDMLEGEPAKGDKAAWPMDAGPSVVSAAKVLLGREGAIDELKKATDCKACHSVYK